jgi:nucleoside-diphosphate-sugar epimerase
MRILITGGTGFIGSAFVRAARSAGHQLAVLSRRYQPDARGCAFVMGSLAEPPWAELEQFAPEACLHAAWIATPETYLESPENHDWVRLSKDFLSGLVQRGTSHLTVLGTCIEYQMTGRPLAEDTSPLKPISTYARAKCELHKSLRRAGHLASVSESFKLAWLRIFYPYGEGEHQARLTSSVIAKLHRGEVVPLKTPHSIKDYIHAEDAADAILAVVERQFDGAVNVGTGAGVTVEAVATELGRLLNRPELIKIPANSPVDPLNHVVADAARLRSLGWRPQVALSDGLRRLVEARTR